LLIHFDGENRVIKEKTKVNVTVFTSGIRDHFDIKVLLPVRFVG